MTHSMVRMTASFILYEWHGKMQQVKRSRSLQEIQGEFSREFIRFDSGTALAALADKTVIKGDWEEGSLIPGLSYKFYGKFVEHHKYGNQFWVKQLIKAEPKSQRGIVKYLEKYAPGVGTQTAFQLYDEFGNDAVMILRTDPVRAAKNCRYLSIEKAEKASEALKEIAELEETKIELTNLFAGRGFPSKLTDEVIKRWGILAPTRIQRDPLTLLVEGFAGCGFARCDRLYIELGLNPARLKRQTLCAWHIMKSDSSGDTWHAGNKINDLLKQRVSGAKLRIKSALKLGLRSGWLALKKDTDGKVWFTEISKAKNEKILADAIKELSLNVMA